MIRHLNRKFICHATVEDIPRETLINEITRETGVYACMYCSKTYNRWKYIEITNGM